MVSQSELYLGVVARVGCHISSVIILHYLHGDTDSDFLGPQGVIRALEERGIPIDYIAGTSIGAFIAGLYARDCDIILSASRAKQFSSRMSNVWRMLSDVTYPLVAYTTVSVSILKKSPQSIASRDTSLIALFIR